MNQRSLGHDPRRICGGQSVPQEDANDPDPAVRDNRIPAFRSAAVAEPRFQRRRRLRRCDSPGDAGARVIHPAVAGRYAAEAGGGARGPMDGLYRYAHRHARRQAARGSIRLEGRPENSALLEHLPAKERQQVLGVRPGRHLRRQGRELEEADQCGLHQSRLLRRSDPVRQGPHELFHHQTGSRGQRRGRQQDDRRHVREFAG